MGKRAKRTLLVVKVQGRKAPAKIETVYGQTKNPHGIALEPMMMGFASGAPGANKSQRLELRLTKLQKDFISKAASVSGFKNVSDYILHIAISDSKNVIHEQQIFELSERDRISFMGTLDSPPAPGKNLKKAKANYLSFHEGK